MTWRDWYDALDIAIVWVTILWAMKAIWPHHRWIALAQIPYLIWVTIASILQFSISWSNGWHQIPLHQIPL